MITEQQAREHNLKTMRSDDSVRVRQDETLAQLKALLPNVVNAENQLDLPCLREALGRERVGDEKGLAYELTFAGKDVARKLADVPSTKELQTEPQQGKTANAGKASENVVIRGDNLDALKLLQQNYFGKVKLIYIDPPYNTQSENFLYADNFKASGVELCEQLDYDTEDLNSLLDLYGMQSHSGWLAFMYPRLKLARNLLTQDGVIFISIDDNEQANLKILMDEIFGGDSFVGCIKVHSNPRGRQSSSNIAETSEYLLVFTKSSAQEEVLDGEKLSAAMKREYKATDETGNYRLLGLRHRASNNVAYYVKTLDFPVFYSVDEDEIKLEKTRDDDIEILPYLEGHEFGRWTWSKEKIKKDKHLLVCKKTNGRYDLFRKDYLYEDKRTKSKDMWVEKEINYDRGAEEIKELFGARAFPFGKPVFLMNKIIQISTNKDDLILDFFAGSGTTGDAVMQLNAEDGGRRKFVLVQWDEAIGKKTEAYKFCTENKLAPVISSITIERLNRAGEKIKAEMEGENGDLLKAREELDVGYQVFSLKDKIRLDTEGEQVSAFATVNERRCRADALVNLIAASCVPLHFAVTEIEKDLLYRVDNYVYVLGACEHSLEDFADCDIYVDGYADLNLKEFLNLIGTEHENLRVVY